MANLVGLTSTVLTGIKDRICADRPQLLSTRIFPGISASTLRLIRRDAQYCDLCLALGHGYVSLCRQLDDQHPDLLRVYDLRDPDSIGRVLAAVDAWLVHDHWESGAGWAQLWPESTSRAVSMPVL